MFVTWEKLEKKTKNAKLVYAFNLTLFFIREQPNKIKKEKKLLQLLGALIYIR